MGNRPLTTKQKRVLVNLLSIDGQAVDGRTALGLEKRGLVVVHKSRDPVSMVVHGYYCLITHEGRRVALDTEFRA